MAWQWWKKAGPHFPKHYPGRMEVESYTTRLEGMEWSLQRP